MAALTLGSLEEGVLRASHLSGNDELGAGSLNDLALVVGVLETGEDPAIHLVDDAVDHGGAIVDRREGDRTTRNLIEVGANRVDVDPVDLLNSLNRAVGYLTDQAKVNDVSNRDTVVESRERKPETANLGVARPARDARDLYLGHVTHILMDLPDPVVLTRSRGVDGQSVAEVDGVDVSSSGARPPMRRAAAAAAAPMDLECAM
ncbi:hypothetical protein [Actinomyces urogenitalis]|nr:hypothetical protein [Actinomyces urogenitalis]MDU5427352.1 hypothetical protein [Actinomyces urogenitalis]